MAAAQEAQCSNLSILSNTTVSNDRKFKCILDFAKTHGKITASNKSLIQSRIRTAPLKQLLSLMLKDDEWLMNKIGDLYTNVVLKLIAKINNQIHFLSHFKHKQINLKHYLKDCKSTENICKDLPSWTFVGTRGHDNDIIDALFKLAEIIDRKYEKHNPKKQLS